MIPLRMLSLCAGIGAIDLAAELTGGIEVVGQVEINPFCQKVLAKHWPNVKRLPNLKEVAGDEFGTIDIVAGGIPCQPFSKAGKRQGTADDRHLWPFAFAIIKVAKPTWVVIENVDDFINMAFDMVASDLESEGYEVQAYILPACAVGAPHQRQRCFVMAHAFNTRRTPTRDISSSQISQREESRWEQSTSRIRRSGESNASNVAYTNGRKPQRRGNAGNVACSQRNSESTEEKRERIWNSISDSSAIMEYTSSARPQEQYVTPIAGNEGLIACGPDTQRKQWQSQPRLGGSITGFADWMDRLGEWRWPALPGQLQYDWEPPRTIIEKLPNRRQRLEALGNAVVWQQIYPFFKLITQMEEGSVA
jgi:DNA (cytosine-5)-methyltransferase 1